MITQSYAIRGTQGVIESMNTFPCGSAYGRAHGRTRDFVRGKVYKWDFAGMADADSERGTVEFRQPPGSLGASDAVGWVMLTLCFVSGGLVLGNQLDGVDVVSEEGASMQDLWELVVRGAGMLGWEDGVGREVEGVFAWAE